MAKMQDRELTAILAAEKADALSGMMASKLAADRATALDYYNGDMSSDMPAPTDRSKAVSSDVADTVEGLMPSLMEIFCAGDEIVKFAPVGPEDEAAAQQETDYVNHVFMQKNPGFLIAYTFIKDALLSKNGIVKIWWDAGEKEERETYLNRSNDELAVLMSDPNNEIVEHTQNDDGTHDVTIACKRPYGQVRIDPVPPEEFGTSRRSKLGHQLDYCFHEVRRTEAQMIRDGYDKDQVEKIPTAGPSLTMEQMARDTVQEQQPAANDINKANRQLIITEHYAMLDYEGDGKPALYRITTGGHDDATILKRNGEKEIVRVDFDPFAAMTPVIVTHRFFGKSVADLVLDIQRIKTSILRGMLDNVTLANNQRLEVAEEFASPKTLDDILNNRPGGIVRTKRPGGLLPIPNQPIGEFAFPMLEYIDQTREWRSGVVRQGQGIDADALQNQSATAVRQVYNAAQAKMKLIARIMAETGFRDMFAKIHATIRKNETQEQTVQLRNKWVPVNPREWKRRDDMTISVGLGSGGKSEQMMFWGTILNMQKEAILLPGQNIVKPVNIYNSLKKYMEAGGEKAIEQYWSDPADPQNPQPPTPPDPKVVEAQGKMQLQAASQQHDQQMQQQKAASDQALASQQLHNDMQKHAAEMALKSDQMQQELQLKREQLAAELQLKREQMAAELDLQRETAMIGARAKVESAQVSSDVRVGGEPG